MQKDTVAQRAELATLAQRLASEPGTHTTPVNALSLIRANHPTPPHHAVAQPSFCIIAQGSKQTLLGSERYVYDPLHYLVISAALPLIGNVIEATPEKPYLCLRIEIDPVEISHLIADMGMPDTPATSVDRGLYVECIDDDLLDAVIRLTRLLEAPRDIPILAPLIYREVLYRLLRGPQGHRLYETALTNSQTHRVNQAIDWLNQHYREPFRIETLAQQVNLSISTLHHRFKAVTAMSPLQYQKQLRLQEAKRLIWTEGLDAATAAYRVGYESPSQFSREYSRLFGVPPMKDLARLRISA
ncbi:AraC-like DNA-binding protein [Pseudomonas duriflava]|uniref:AraC-like DNA-binding protein n=1 Tax=Pseudomonas duriflava TaxID=459528 RepID=A0A562Q6V8_9PSED|nr:AraC family transcriptional regulator [Pseudomonas duriflava]TWI52463.1 AraC-like DNA-binding protein [Pseudomonas duriflava]